MIKLFIIVGMYFITLCIPGTIEATKEDKEVLVFDIHKTEDKVQKKYIVTYKDEKYFGESTDKNFKLTVDNTGDNSILFKLNKKQGKEDLTTLSKFEVKPHKKKELAFSVSQKQNRSPMTLIFQMKSDNKESEGTFKLIKRSEGSLTKRELSELKEQMNAEIEQLKKEVELQKELKNKEISKDVNRRNDIAAKLSVLLQNPKHNYTGPDHSCSMHYVNKDTCPRCFIDDVKGSKMYSRFTESE